MRKHQRARHELPDLIAHEDSSAAKAEDAKFEYSRGFIIEPTVDAEAGQPGEASTERRQAEIRGDPEISKSALPKGLEFGATGKRGLVGGARGVKSRGNPEVHSEGETRGAKIRGDLKIYRWQSRKVRSPG